MGQLCGDTDNGIWNTSEAWPLMLSTAKLLGCLPTLEESLGWLAADVAAKAVLEIALTTKRKPEHTRIEEPKEEREKSCPVYHVLNPHDSTTWNDLLSWVHKLSSTVKTVSVYEWLTKLENLEGEASGHPARKLLGLWKNAYTDDPKGTGEDQQAVERIEQGKQKGGVRWEMIATCAIAPVMRNVEPVSEEQVEKMWRWIETEMM